MINKKSENREEIREKSLRIAENVDDQISVLTIQEKIEDMLNEGMNLKQAETVIKKKINNNDINLSNKNEEIKLTSINSNSTLFELYVQPE